MENLKTTQKGRDELRANAKSALEDAESITGMILCGQIITLLDDIDYLVKLVGDDENE